MPEGAGCLSANFTPTRFSKTMPFFRAMAQLVAPPRYVTLDFPSAETEPMLWYSYPDDIEMDRPSSTAAREEMKISLSPKRRKGRINRMLKMRHSGRGSKSEAQRKTARGARIRGTRGKEVESPGFWGPGAE